MIICNAANLHKKFHFPTKLYTKTLQYVCFCYFKIIWDDIIYYGDQILINRKYTQNENTYLNTITTFENKYTMKTEYQMRIILKLRTLREQNNISQIEIAHYLGISPGQLGNIESNKQNHKYTLKQVYMLCKKFNEPLTNVFCEGLPITIDNLVNEIIRYEENE